MLTKTKIVFMFAYAPTPWDAERYGFAALREAGIMVEVFDLSALIATRHYLPGTIFYQDPLLTRVRSYLELSGLIAKCAVDSYFVDTINGLNGLQWHGRDIYRLLKKLDAKYIIIEIGGLPIGIATATTISQRLQRYKKVKKIIPFLQRKIGRWLIHFQQYLFSCYQLPSYIFVSHHDLIPRYLAQYDLPKTIIQPIHSFDHDRYLNFLQENKNALIAKAQCTFIDQGLLQHCDFGLNHNARPVTANNYFQSLNNFFDHLEEKTQLVVKIAASPRASYDPSPFGARPVLKQATMAESLQSQLIITHSSTAVSYAVLVNRPILLLTTDEMKKALGFYQFIFKMAQALQVSVLNIDDAQAVADFDFAEYLQRPFQYDRYKYRYVMTEGLPATTIWKQVARIFN